MKRLSHFYKTELAIQREMFDEGALVICAKYGAQAEIVSIEQGVCVEVLSTVPGKAWLPLLEASVTEIRRAVEAVLQPRGVGAIVRLRDLYIHDVDCSPQAYGKLTAEALKKALGENQA